jgi:dTDP-4-dehydrorhamnose reductase
LSGAREEILIRILLIGAAGQLGRELHIALTPFGSIMASDRAALDLVEEDSIRRTIAAVRPDLIVNAAAYTNVDSAETEPALAIKVNTLAPKIIAQAAHSTGALLIHYSTDYVFSGALKRPYREDDEPDPINTYGRTKLAGEREIAAAGAPHIVLRTSWLFAKGGRNFFSNIIKLAREQEELKVVDDQIGIPNWSRSVANATTRVIEWLISRGGTIAEAGRELSGIYHLCGPDSASRYEFAREIIELYGRGAKDLPPLRVKRLVPVRSEEFPSAATRPKYSVLCSDKIQRAFGVRLPSWREQLALAFT